MILVLLSASLMIEPPPAPVDLAARVSARVAEAWRVDSSAVRLEWGRLPAPLPTADAPLTLEGNGVSGWFVAVIGEGDAKVAVRVRAGLDRTVNAAARPLPRGVRIEAGDVTAVTRVRWGPPVESSRGEAGPGWETRRPFAAGEIIAWPAAVPPALVVNGAPVRLTWARGGVRVTLDGTALNSARAGEAVRARVPGRGAALSGIATAPGEAALAGERP